MSLTKIEENVDIYQLPEVGNNHKAINGSAITIGDLHGNAMKLLFMLFKHGVATNLINDDYQELVAIYNTPVEDLNKDKIDKFNLLLDKIQFNNAGKIRLIGDELADRGCNDYFTLRVIQKLNENKVPVEIILSNHSIEFIEAYEKQDDFHAPMLRYGHADSMERLQALIDKKVISRNEVLDIANKH